MMQVSPVILDTGANNTYVNDRRLITNLTSGSASVEVADGSHHHILASGNLVIHPSIPAHLVPSFKNNSIGISPIIDTGAVGIIQSNNMTLVKHSPLVDKILHFVLKYSHDNNLIILTGHKSNDLYITNLYPKVASLSIASRHFPSIKELVNYFYIVFNCPNVDTYRHLSIKRFQIFHLILQPKMSVNIIPTMILFVLNLSNLKKTNSSIYWFKYLLWRNR
jgi:hypothetical protein